MSMTTANLSAALMTAGKLSPADVERLREQWHRAYGDPHRALIHCPVPFWAPAQIDPPSPLLPIPFRWGPNGPFLMLLAMLAVYAVIVMILP
jgi:hypothetical protein